MIHNEKVIAGQSLCRLVEDSLGRIGHGDRVLDIGAGSGRIMRSLLQKDSFARVTGLEIDSELCRLGDEAGLDFVCADVREMPFEEGSFDTVTAVNTFHEVAESNSFAARQANFELAIRQTARIMKLGGRLIMFDGFMPNNACEELTMQPLKDKSMDLLTRFETEYLAFKPRFSIYEAEPPVIDSNVGSVVTLLTKLKYLINGTAWNGERQQLYTFSTLGAIVEVLNNNGLKVEQIAHPTANVRLGLKSLLGNFAISTANGKLSATNFPHCQALIQAKKVA